MEPTPRGVLWEEGLFLQPHHLQQQALGALSLAARHAGVPFLVVGAVFGAKALGCNSDHNAWVDGGKKGDEPCDASAARSVDANIANAGLGLGVVGLAVGGYLYFTAPKGSGKVGVAPLVSPSATGLSLRARF